MIREHMCSDCCVRTHSGDVHVRHCGACGKLLNQAAVNSVTNKGVPVDFHRIHSRIGKLDNAFGSTSYAKQKHSLEAELCQFLRNVNAVKDVSNAIPEDIRMFLIHKEANGRTRLHSKVCPLRSLPEKCNWDCPTTLPSKSVDSLIGKVRAIFRDAGRTGEWNPATCSGNPASASLMKRHLKCIVAEQTAAEVAHRQAVPLMFDKLTCLCRHLMYKCYVESDPTTKVLYARDCAYFSLLSHSGGRGGDLGLLTSSRIFGLPESQGILISQIEGKTVNVDNPNNIILLLSKDPDICPVAHLSNYIKTASQAGVDLHTGFLFRARDPKSRLISVSDKPVTSSLMTERLRLHLTAIGMYEGETAHSGRRGCAIVLRMLGLADSSINSHIGWGSTAMLDHYARVGGIMNPSGVAGTLANAAEMTNNSSQLLQISEKFKSFSRLKRFCFDSQTK